MPMGSRGSWLTRRSARAPLSGRSEWHLDQSWQTPFNSSEEKLTVNHLKPYALAAAIIAAHSVLCIVKSNRSGGRVAAVVGIVLSLSAVAGAVLTCHANPAPVRIEGAAFNRRP